MNNKELIENLARKLEKFNFTEIVVLSEINEDEVQHILEELIIKNTVVQRDSLYFYQKNPINKKSNRQEKYTNVPPFELEKMDGYDEYLKLTGNAKHLSDMRIVALKMTHGLYGKDLKNMLNLYNSQHPNDKIASSTLASLKNQLKNYGLKGILAKYKHARKDEFPTIIYETFKKYYLNKNKFSTEQALKFAQTELQNLHKIEFPQVYCAKPFMSKLLKEMGKETINYLRNTFDIDDENIKNKPIIKEPTDMLFSEAAKIYFDILANNKDLERLMNEKTSYKNHILPYFENYKICDITLDTLREFKERKYNDGYSVSSVSHYILVIKFIIRNVSSEFENFAKRTKRIGEYDFIEMNILTKNTIKKLLHYTKDNYLEAYPIIKLSLLTGATVPEIFALTWQDINLENKSIHINKFLYFDNLRKYNNPFNCRNLFLDDEITEILISKNHAENSNEYIFKLNTDDYPQTFFEEKILKTIVKKLKLGKFLHTDLVHNFVNLLLEQKVPITYISKQCGINNQKFIAIYEKLIKQKEKEKYNSLKGIC